MAGQHETDSTVHGTDVRLGVDGLSVVRGRRHVVSSASFEARRGVYALLGPNGAGKSSLIGALVGELATSQGTVSWDGAQLTNPVRQRIGVGWLPQELRFPSSMKVREVVEYAAWARKVTNSADAVERALRLGDTSELAGRRVGRLSGGQKRRVGLSASSVGDPGLMLLDEPTTGLDPLQRSGFHEQIRTLGRDRTVILATHLLEDVAATADSVVVMHEGVVRFSGSVSEFTDGADRSVESLRAALIRRIGMAP